MAIEEVLNSFKAKMYDFTYSPFISSFVISWVIINYKFIMILISDKDVVLKLHLIKLSSFSPLHFYLYPVLVALFYVFAYPWISLWFYKYTLARDNEKKKAKLDALKQKPYPYEEVVKLFDDIKKYQEQIEVLQGELIINAEHIESKYELQIDDLNNQVIELNDNMMRISKERDDLQQDINLFKKKDAYSEETNQVTDDEMTKHVEKYIELQKLLSESKSKFISKIVIQALNENNSEEMISNAIENGQLFKLTDDKFLIVEKTEFTRSELIIMKILYDGNYSGNDLNHLISMIMSVTQFKRIQIETLVASLINKKIIQVQTGYYTFTENAKQILLDLFDENLK